MKTLSISLAITIAIAATGASATWATTAVYGAYDPRQQEALWNTAIELQAQGNHEEAIPVLKRATHISRISDGLNAASQIPYIRAEIRSYRALNQLALADQRNAYLSRIEKEVLPSGTEKIDALLRQAEWHQHALLEEIDEEEERQARVGKMWNFYRRALNESIATFGDSSEDLLPALHGMVRAQYLLAGHQGVGAAMPGNMRRERTSASQSKSSFKRGISLFIAMQQLNRDRLEASREVQAEDLIRMGDWAWWTGNRNYALAFYGDALKLANGELLDRGAEANVSAEEAANGTAGLVNGEQFEEQPMEATDAAIAPVTSEKTETGPTNESASPIAESTGDDGARITNGNNERGETVDARPDHPNAEKAVANTTHREQNTAVESISADTSDADARADEEEALQTEKFPTFRILEEPVPLPAIKGLDPVFALKSEPATEADLIVTFTVNANGKIDNLKKIQVPMSTGKNSPDTVLRRMRRLRFRPVFDGGVPVDSDTITWVLSSEHWTSPSEESEEVST